jgi:hypothetical protein
MRKYGILALILISSGIASGQNYTLPAWVYDSMAFEVRKGRSCEVLKDSLEIRVLSLSEINLQKDTRITGLVAQVANVKALEASWPDRMDNQAKTFQLDKAALRQKVKKRNRVIIGMAGTIAVLVAVILGG